ncbi:MAG: putative ABC transporter ATP-binding protein YbhF [Firmicutes bacterium ADurb.Bin193]|nr:MAG: putative ABC transporter ATP-binding protein YbhF [Firmicutes bacterium ADurb.Bin193]
MQSAVILANNLSKEFITTKKSSGLRGAVKNLFKPEKTVKRAVDHVSFEITKGEIVGYIGPNGAGKSTTIKMMCGILNPTGGNVLINGMSPVNQRQKIVMDLGVVFGQRSQLYWDLPLGESFELLRRIYLVDRAKYEANLAELDRILNVHEFIDTPVRQLSLGQRMRGDLAAAMLHSPSVLFLDEPTIGLDVDVKYAIRKFIKEINEKYQTTVILTTHDLDDIQALCKRIIIINDGIIVSDSPLEELIEQELGHRLLIVELSAGDFHVTHPKAEITPLGSNRLQLKFRKDEISAAALISDISAQYQIRDLQIKEADINDVIRQIYARSKAACL